MSLDSLDILSSASGNGLTPGWSRGAHLEQVTSKTHFAHSKPRGSETNHAPSILSSSQYALDTCSWRDLRSVQGAGLDSALSDVLGRHRQQSPTRAATKQSPSPNALTQEENFARLVERELDWMRRAKRIILAWKTEEPTRTRVASTLADPSEPPPVRAKLLDLLIDEDLVDLHDSAIHQALKRLASETRHRASWMTLLQFLSSDAGDPATFDSVYALVDEETRAWFKRARAR